MIVEITIKDREGNVLVPTQQFDAFKPAQWRTGPDKPLVEMEDPGGDTVIVHQLYGFTYQQMAKRDLRRR